MLVGATTGDDAGVFRIGPERALVATVDFFTPIVNDPRAYGAIAAANAVSDIYAMGAELLFALSLVSFPRDLLPFRIPGADLGRRGRKAGPGRRARHRRPQHRRPRAQVQTS